MEAMERTRKQIEREGGRVVKIINEEREGEKNKDEEGRREEKNCCEKKANNGNNQ